MLTMLGMTGTLAGGLKRTSNCC